MSEIASLSDTTQEIVSACADKTVSEALRVLADYVEQLTSDDNLIALHHDPESETAVDHGRAIGAIGDILVTFGKACIGISCLAPKRASSS